ncbi:hypothetical protein [Streptomyces sp. NPDC057545]|uniref:hypothetical protein n=1 Tax=unclassified Streptomyces TaxID=2593676 RepID=UPI0036BC73C8
MPLEHGSWESYCAAEFGISCAQAYRLLDVARSLTAIHGAVTAGTELSRTRDTGPAASAALDYPATVRAVVRQAVRDVRTAPPPPAADPPADPTVAAALAIVDDLVAINHEIGELMLEVAPAYLSDTDAADVLALLCDQIGEPLEHGLAASRYAMSSDRRALHGTVL